MRPTWQNHLSSSYQVRFDYFGSCSSANALSLVDDTDEGVKLASSAFVVPKNVYALSVLVKNNHMEPDSIIDISGALVRHSKGTNENERFLFQMMI
jgi:hypothetical protein